MRKRGYMVFAAVVVAAVLLLFLLPKQEQQPLSAEDSFSADSLVEESGHSAVSRPPRFSRKQYAASAESRNACSKSDSIAPASRTFRTRRTRVALNGGDTLDWQQLHNIGPAFARRIVKYRSLLGGYISKEQLLEVYGMDSVRYNSIAPYIDFDSVEIARLDINTATIDQLKRHPYLDYYQAKGIVRLREQEGAYHSVSDIRRIPVIDQETYNKIFPYITCNSQPNR